MVRTSLLILAFAIAVPAAAQNTSTQCRWIGNVWSCDSRQRGGIQPLPPVDQGKVMRDGAAMVPDLAAQEARRRELRIRERELELRERELNQAEAAAKASDLPALASRVVGPDNLGARFGLPSNQIAMIQNILAACPKDDRTPMNFAGVPDDQRAVIGSICFAFDQGKLQRVVNVE